MTTNMDTEMGNLKHNCTEHNGTHATCSKDSIFKGQLEFQDKLICSLIILICIPGVIGNGTVIQVLGSQIKRKPFTIYILNLSVADSGTLISLFLHAILVITTGHSTTEITECFVCTYCTVQFLLTIISIDRCLSIFFPIWYQYHRPPYMSTILCTITWIVSFLFCTIHYILFLKEIQIFDIPKYLFICTTICIPLMLVSSLALFIKGYLKSWRKRRGKLLIAILLALFFFLIFSFPPTIIYLIYIIFNQKYFYLFIYGYLCACLNSSVNPLIYFLLGRKKELHSTFNLKNILQKFFNEEEENEEQPEVQVDIQL